MKFYLGVFGSAIVMFAWGAFFWMVLPARWGMMQALPNEEAVFKALADGKPETGVYLAPWFPKEVESLPEKEREAITKATMQRHKSGPLVSVMYRTDGVDMESPSVMIQGFVHMLLTAAMLGVLVKSLLSWSTFGARWAFVVAVALIAAVWIDFSAAIWWHFPWRVQLFHASYHVSAWMLGALPLAWGAAGAPLAAPRA